MRLASGDELAFGKLVDRYWQAVYNHALTFLKSPQTAEEITLDVFELIWRKREKLAAVDRFPEWLFIVSKRLFISATRKKINHIPPAQEVLQFHSEEVQMPDHSLELQELSALIEKGIRQLTPKQRQIFLLSRADGLTHDQIAEQLGISRNTVKNHLVTSLNFLRRSLAESGNVIFCLVWLCFSSFSNIFPFLLVLPFF